MNNCSFLLNILWKNLFRLGQWSSWGIFFTHTICPSESIKHLFSCRVFAVKLMLLLLTLPEHLVWNTMIVLFQTLFNYKWNVIHHLPPSSHILSFPENVTLLRRGQRRSFSGRVGSSGRQDSPLLHLLNIMFYLSHQGICFPKERGCLLVWRLCTLKLYAWFFYSPKNGKSTFGLDWSGESVTLKSFHKT